MSRLLATLAALCLAPTLALAQMASAPFEGRLKKIQETKTIAVAYRTDALPFSFEDAEKKPAGYMVDLCRSVIGVIKLSKASYRKMIQNLIWATAYSVCCSASARSSRRHDCITSRSSARSVSCRCR